MPEHEHNSFFSSDQNLLLRLKKYKDKEAFLVAYDNYANDIYRFLYFKVGNVEEAQDLTSSTFVKAWSVVRDGQLKDDDSYKTLKAFLYKIARNQAIDYYRQKKTVNFSDLSEEQVDFGDEGDAVGRVINNIDNHLLIEHLNKLKLEYRNVLVMYYVNELNVAEISKVLDKSRGNVRVLLFRATKALKDLMDHKSL